MAYKFLWRRGSSEEWAKKDVVLRPGEPGLEEDTDRFKLGDGIHSWNELPYFIDADKIQDLIEAGSPGGSDLASHINSSLPHPIYDDGPSLVLLYENAKV